MPVEAWPTNTNDFLLIRKRDRHGHSLNTFNLRPIEHMFAAGQPQPRTKVPAPSEKEIVSILRNRIDWYMSHIYTGEDVVNIDMEYLLDSHWLIPPGKIESRLKRYTYRDRYGVWHSAGDAPTKEEIQNLISPEECCFYESILRHHYSLAQVGHISQDSRNEAIKVIKQFDDPQHIMTYIEDLVMSAGWNTTFAWHHSTANKAILRLHEWGNDAAKENIFRRNYVNAARMLRTEDLKRLNNKENKATTVYVEHKLSSFKLQDLAKALRALECPLDVIIETQSHGRWPLVDLLTKICSLKYLDGDRSDLVMDCHRSSEPTAARMVEIYSNDVGRVIARQIALLRNDDLLAMEREERLESKNELNDIRKKSEAQLLAEIDRAMSSYSAPTPRYLTHSSETHQYTKENASASTTTTGSTGKIKHKIIKQVVKLLDENGNPVVDARGKQMFVTRYYRDPVLVQAYLEFNKTYPQHNIAPEEIRQNLNWSPFLLQMWGGGRSVERSSHVSTLMSGQRLAVKIQKRRHAHFSDHKQRKAQMQAEQQRLKQVQERMQAQYRSASNARSAPPTGIKLTIRMPGISLGAPVATPTSTSTSSSSSTATNGHAPRPTVKPEQQPKQNPPESAEPPKKLGLSLKFSLPKVKTESQNPPPQ